MSIEGSVPHQFLHLETGIFLVFLATILWTQLARSHDPNHYTQQSRAQMFSLMSLCAVLCVVFGYFLSSLSLLLAIELAIGFTLALLHPVNALCLFVHMLFLRPWEIMPENPLLSALPRLLVTMCLISWFLHPWQRNKLTAQVSHALTLLAVFSGWLFLTTFRTSNIANSQALWFDSYFRSFIVFVMCLFFIKNKRSVSEFKHTIIISILGVVILAFYQFLCTLPSTGDVKARLQANGVLGDSNDLAAITIIVFPLVAAPLFTRIKPFQEKALGIILSTISALAIWYSQSRGAFLAFLMEILGMRCFKDFYKYRLRALAMAGFLGLGYIGLLKILPRTPEDVDTSTQCRITYWVAAINMTLHHPVWGVGFFQYPANYEAYTPIIKYEWGRRTAHSSWLLAFAESGVVGGSLFIAFFFAVLKTAWRNRQQRADQFCALVGYGVAMSFLSHTYLLYLYLLSGLVLASDSVKEHAQGG